MNSANHGEFTYCGDLVGTSSMYASAPEQAYNFLSHFYNIVFNTLADYQEGAQRWEVHMFSDSLIVTGGDFEAFVRNMCGVYIALLNDSLLLRGGLVGGRLEFDPRKTRADFQKMLPQGDTPARANALEKSVKGARFVVASDIAHQLVGQRRDWLTLQGYIGNPMAGTEMPVERSPLATGAGFEILYPVYEKARTDDGQLGRNLERMYYLMNASPREVAVHYGETIALINHSQARRSHMSRPRLP